MWCGLVVDDSANGGWFFFYWGLILLLVMGTRLENTCIVLAKLTSEMFPAGYSKTEGVNETLWTYCGYR